ncbi:unnamed protein product, partial [Staurois parvus]
SVPSSATHQFRPPVPSSAPTCAQQCTHLCHPAVPPTYATQQCHPPVPSSATHLCPPVPPTSAHQCSPAVLPVSATNHQCCLSVPPIRDTSLVLPISAAYPCHLISAVHQCRLSV